jgi:predicted nucleic acid-binding Zn ribbon protein
MRYDAKCSNCGEVEIEKRMIEPWPDVHFCGGQLVQRYVPTQVVYRATGFYHTDVTRFRSQMSPERFARFEAERDATLRRYATDRITSEDRAAELD